VTAAPETHAQIPPESEVAAILVVDDNAFTAKALARKLEQANYRTSVALSGSEALAIADSHAIAGAVIDIHLPDINGLVLSQRLRQRLGPDKPIIVLSGDTSMEVINSLQHVGASYFFSKPVNAGQLIEQLKQMAP